MVNLFKQIAAKNINIKEFPFFSELNIEAFIIENPQILSSDEIINPEIINSQIYLHAGRSEGDGRIDLLAKTSNDILLVIEIKNGILNDIHLNQLGDYLKAFEKKKKDIMQGIDPDNDYENFQIKGILIGIEITSSLKDKLLQGCIFGNSEIYGLIINRFTTHDSTENYIMTDYILPHVSQRIRYKVWGEFVNNQKRRGVPTNIINISKKIHDDFIKQFKLSEGNVQYTPTTFTLSVPASQRKRVFAYAILRKNDVKIYLTNNGLCPNGAFPHENLDRYPDSHYVIITNDSDYNDQVKKMISDSYEVIINYYK